MPTAAAPSNLTAAIRRFELKVDPNKEIKDRLKALFYANTQGVIQACPASWPWQPIMARDRLPAMLEPAPVKGANKNYHRKKAAAAKQSKAAKRRAILNMEACFSLKAAPGSVQLQLMTPVPAR